MTTLGMKRLTIGHHQRWECVSRPGQWCRLEDGKGNCASCPLRAKK